MSEQELKEKVGNEELEVRLLLEALYLKYGYDFRRYSFPHIKRRVMHRMMMEGAERISDLQYKLIYDKEFLRSILADFSINVTEMFRDPSFYKAFREHVVPILKTYPFIRIWHAGCSTGEEVYSMAILLKEEGLYDRVQIYATDFNTAVLDKVKEGIYPLANVKNSTHNYQKSGGKASFADYYIAKYDSIIFDSSLKQKITVADHNLVSDGVFGEMHVIICRNVLIYFNKELQNKVIGLFIESLVNGCFLCLGSKEDIKFITNGEKFNEFVEREKIYQKKYLR